MNLNYATPSGYVNKQNPSLQEYEALLQQLAPDYLSEIQLVTDKWVLMVSISNNKERVKVTYSEHKATSPFADEHYAIDTTLQDYDTDKTLEFTMINGETYTHAFYRTVPKDVAIKIALSIFENQVLPDWTTWKSLKDS